jgi:hypothetical protein
MQILYYRKRSKANCEKVFRHDTCEVSATSIMVPYSNPATFLKQRQFYLIYLRFSLDKP